MRKRGTYTLMSNHKKNLLTSKCSTRTLTSNISKSLDFDDIQKFERTERISGIKGNLVKSRCSQVSIFVIIAIIIVTGIFLYFAVKGQITLKKIPASLEPLEQYFKSCIEDEAERGIEILGTRGGYIYLQEFVPGSEYMPFSSQLDFLGQPVPYWYYVSGNNIVKEQAPSKIEMERQLSRFLEDRITECDFSSFEQRGIFAFIEEPKFNVNIEDNKVKVNLNLIFTITNGEETWQIKNLKTEVNSKIGKFYDLALDIYNKEKQEMFLENYAVDILRLYMPVDGVEMTCSPKIWTESDLLEELKQAITVNTERLKLSKNKGKDYFAIDLNSDESVDFLYSENWPTKLEVEPSESGVLIAEPVGNQPGLGVMGFCYVPYHFIYDLTYPVLIQIYDNKEMFQFPVAVIINKNKAREAFLTTSVGEQEVELCKYKNNEVVVYTYNNNLKPVEADISFKCFTEKCDIGKTKEKNGDAVLIEKFPQCINGFIIAESEGYEPKYYQISTNVEGVADILLDKLYDLDLDLKVENKETEEQAIIYFQGEGEKSKTVVWPQVKSVSLSEGFYNISAYVYTNSELTIPASSERKCVKVPQSGLFGIFGATEEKCFDIEFPEQKISAGIIAGGKTQDYLTEQELEKGMIEINVEKLPTPTTLEQLQDNYNLLEIKKAELKFG